MIHIVSAASFEASPLLEKLNTYQIPYHFTAIGVGPLEAAANKENIKSAITGNHVIYLGTCGIFDSFKGVQLIRGHKVDFSCPGERHNLAASIERCYPSLTFPKPLLFQELEPKHILTSPSISLSPLISNQDLPYSQSIKSALVENMEAYPLAWIANQGKSFSSIFAITNQVGPEGRIQWKQNFKEAALITADYIINNYINIINKL